MKKDKRGMKRGRKIVSGGKGERKIEKEKERICNHTTCAVPGSQYSTSTLKIVHYISIAPQAGE